MAHKRDASALARSVSRDSEAKAVRARSARNGDHSAESAVAHVVDHYARAIHDAVEIYVDVFSPFSGFAVTKLLQTHAHGNARVVDEDVDRADRVGDCRDGRIDIVVVGHIETARDCVSASSCDRCNCLLCSVSVQIIHRNDRALLRKGSCNPRADTLARARYQRHFAIEIKHDAHARCCRRGIHRAAHRIGKYCRSMTFPNFAGKHGHDAFFSPHEMRDWREARGMLPEHVPEALIFIYQDALFEGVCEFENNTVLGSGMYAKVRTLGRTEGRVAVVGGFGIGAPVAAAILEDMIALGVRRFISIGTAGGMQPNLDPGEIVVCEGAVRDEGVSHHYLPHSVPALPDPALTAALARRVAASGLAYRHGRSWTVDAPYRETAAEVRHYRSEGVCCVEMEAAALFTVAAFRGVAIASAFAMSDSLADAEWNPQFDHPELAHALLTLYGIAVNVLEDTDQQ